tara:strand:+ start:2424 stop:3059 length:636 start_codon:yes stop_codon:yes gene_type:complete
MQAYSTIHDRDEMRKNWREGNCNYRRKKASRCYKKRARRLFNNPKTFKYNTLTRTNNMKTQRTTPAVKTSPAFNDKLTAFNDKLTANTKVTFYTVFEDQRDIPIHGIKSIAIGLPADRACQWFEQKFGTLENIEVYNTPKTCVEADLIVHHPDAFMREKKVKVNTKTQWLEAYNKEQEKQEAFAAMLVRGFAAICAAGIIAIIILYSQSHL